MSDVFQILVFALATGFVVSGIVSNVYSLVTNGQSIFHFPVTSDATRLVMVGLLIFAGPHILFRAAKRSLQIGDWPTAYIVTCFALCSVWSFAVGLLVLKLFIL